MLVLVIHMLKFLYQHIGVAQLIQACGRSCGGGKGAGVRRRGRLRGGENLAHRLSDYYFVLVDPDRRCDLRRRFFFSRSRLRIAGAVKTSSALLWTSESLLLTRVRSFAMSRAALRSPSRGVAAELCWGERERRGKGRVVVEVR